MGNKDRKQIKLQIQKQPGMEESAPAAELLNEAQTEMGLPSFRDSAPSSGGGMSIAELINEGVGAAAQPVPEQVSGEGDLKRFECIGCGLIGEAPAELESCLCPDCGEAMYPLDLFDGEDTVSYLYGSGMDSDEIKIPRHTATQIPETRSGGAMSDSKRLIKVAQPVNVGMFSSTATGTVNPVSSSQSLKPMDFFSSTGSSNSQPLATAVGGGEPDSGSVMSGEILAEIERERKSLQDEWAQLQKQQSEFEAAILEFEKRSQELEAMHLKLELKQQGIGSQTEFKIPQDVITALDGDRLPRMKYKPGKGLIFVMWAVGVLALLQMVVILFLLIRK